MKNLMTIGLTCILGAVVILAYWHVTIHQLNDAPPVPSAEIPDRKTLWHDYPFFASGLLLSGSQPFSGKPNDINHITRTYLKVAAMRDRGRVISWAAIIVGIALVGTSIRERRKVKREPNK